MRTRQLPALFALVALALTGCATTSSAHDDAPRVQLERTSSASERAEQAHRVRAWRSTESFALGGGWR